MAVNASMVHQRLVARGSEHNETMQIMKKEPASHLDEILAVSKKRTIGQSVADQMQFTESIMHPWGRRRLFIGKKLDRHPAAGTNKPPQRRQVKAGIVAKNDCIDQGRIEFKISLQSSRVVRKS
jgi:hypothetical protein